jgi:hypothetical protein
MHRLVQLSMRTWLQAQQELNRWIKTSINAVNAVFPEGRYERWAECQMFLPHAREVIGHVTSDKDDTLNQANIAFKIGWYLVLRGGYEAAQKATQVSADARQVILGPVHRETLNSIYQLVVILARKGQHQEADEMHQRVLEESEKALGQEHPDTLTSISQLGDRISKTGKVQRCRSDALASIRRKREGPWA